MAEMKAPYRRGHRRQRPGAARCGRSASPTCVRIRCRRCRSNSRWRTRTTRRRSPRPARPPSRDQPYRWRAPRSAAEAGSTATATILRHGAVPPPPKPRIEPRARRRRIASPRSPPRSRNASAEDIARMLGGRAPMIPPARERAGSRTTGHRRCASPPPASNGKPTAAVPRPRDAAARPAARRRRYLATIVADIRKLVRPRPQSASNSMRCSTNRATRCRGKMVCSTLGFLRGQFPQERRRRRHQSAHVRRIRVGDPRCPRSRSGIIISPTPARAGDQEPLVQHAVENTARKSSVTIRSR